jgi:dTDP-glucose 4,6-dehydratase
VTTYGLPVVVTRCSNNFGPYQYPEKLIPLFTTNLLDGKKVPLYGDGGNVRDWIHVEDHNIAAQLVLTQGQVGEIYNIGAHNEMTNSEITYLLLGLCERDESFIEPVADRLGHDRRYSVNIDKVTALGWKMTRSFEESLAETVSWYREHRSWWEPLKARAGL